MKDSEKSQEIVNKNFKWISNFVEENNLSKKDRNQIRYKMYSACQEMAEWKKRQMIDKACEWLIENCPTNDGGELYIFIKDFQKAMKGGEQ